MYLALRVTGKREEMITVMVLRRDVEKICNEKVEVQILTFCIDS